jgi:serine/threonine protein kinase
VCPLAPSSPSSRVFFFFFFFFFFFYLRPPSTLRPTDIELGVKIGSGGFSKIYRGTWLGKDVAIKKLRGAMDEATARAFYKEMNLLSGLRHPNVLLLLGATEMEDKMVIVTELMMGGSLYGLLQRYKKKSGGRCFLGDVVVDNICVSLFFFLIANQVLTIACQTVSVLHR